MTGKEGKEDLISVGEGGLPVEGTVSEKARTGESLVVQGNDRLMPSKKTGEKDVARHGGKKRKIICKTWYLISLFNYFGLLKKNETCVCVCLYN